MRCLIGNFLLVLGLLGSCYAEIFNFCKYTAPDADECLAKSIENAVRSLQADNVEYGLKTMKPFAVPKLTIETGNGPVQLVQYYNDIDLEGFHDITVSKAHYDSAKKHILISASFPKIVQKANYRVNGKILTLPVVGNGKSTLVLENVHINAQIQFEEMQKDGQTYFKIKAMPVDIVPKKMSVNFENLFDGNKLLGDNINRVINEEWQALYDDVKPSIDKNYGQLFMASGQTFFDKVPADKIFIK